MKNEEGWILNSSSEMFIRTKYRKKKRSVNLKSKCKILSIVQVYQHQREERRRRRKKLREKPSFEKQDTNYFGKKQQIQCFFETIGIISKILFYHFIVKSIQIYSPSWCYKKKKNKEFFKHQIYFLHNKQETFFVFLMKTEI